jgi:protein ImuB
MLWLCVHLPRLALEIYHRGARADQPLVIAEGEGREQRVVAASEGARRGGVWPGMRVSEAYALASALCVKARDTTAERESLERLAAWSGQYTSCVSLIPPDTLLLEIAGSRRLHGGPDRLTRQVRDGLNDLGYTAWLATAPTPLGATWLARAGREVEITDHAALFSVLAQLPLTCLNLEPQCEVRLTGMGLATLVDCLRLPRDGIARRVGPEILASLDRAFGRLPDPRAAFAPPERFHARLGLPAPVTTREALLFPLHRLLIELAGFLAARGMGAAALDITLHSTRAVSTRVRLQLVAPSRDAQHLGGLVRERLERLTLEAPVEEVRLDVDALLPLAARPLDLFAGPRTPDEARTQLTERLQARFGRDAVRVAACCAEHRPERAWRYVEPGTRTETIADSPLVFARDSRRPLWLLPEPIALDMRDGQPYRKGALTIEPPRERIESGWWDGEEIARDYFVARNPKGQQFWIFRELHTAHWFLHGIFG